MKIKWDDLWLSDELAADGFQSGLVVNGRQVIQEAQFIRAATAGLFARGNRAVTLSFTVTRVFGSFSAAEEFALTHYGALSDGPATLTCRCGSTDILFEEAVLESVSTPTYKGSCVLITYSFRAPGTTSTTTPLFDDVITDTLNIPSGVDEYEFTGLGLPSTPAWVAGSVIGPDGADVLWGMIVQGSVSAAGFKILLNGITPNSNYKFSFMYVL